MERLLARRERCGLTFREVSEESGIPIPTLSYWASKLRREEENENETEGHLVEVEIVDDEESAIVIETGGGLSVTVEPGFDSAHLERVLAVLERC